MTVRKIHFILLAGFLPAVTACDTPPANDYREAYPLVTGTEAVSMSISVPFGKEEVSAEDMDNIGRFVDDYVNRGNGLVVLETGNDEGSAAAARIQRVQTALRNAGLQAKEIRLKTNSSRVSGDDDVMLSFSANAVKVPECGDWTSESSHNWTNRRHSNFGCSVQRNLGLTVADPGDLKKAKPESGTSASRINRVITGHQGGTATGGVHSAKTATSAVK